MPAQRGPATSQQLCEVFILPDQAKAACLLLRTHSHANAANSAIENFPGHFNSVQVRPLAGSRSKQI